MDIKDFNFLKSRPFQCSYLPNKNEQRLIVPINNDNGQSIFSNLSKLGFRRNLDHMYKPNCLNCSQCLSSRIDVKKFIYSKSQRRNLKRNQSFFFKEMKRDEYTQRHKLFIKYSKNRHSEGQMKNMTLHQFNDFLYNSPVESKVYDLTNNKNQLIGSILLDFLDDGLSAVYSFYDPDFIKNGIGKYLILKAIEKVKEIKLQYLYLGYWIEGSDKMNYKGSFNSLEIFTDGSWKLKP